MNYIIMADGKGTRWNNYGDIPKHFIKVEGETLLARTVRLLHEYDPGCRVTITSHDPRYEVEGAVRYEPKNNVLEIDRVHVGAHRRRRVLPLRGHLLFPRGHGSGDRHAGRGHSVLRKPQVHRGP